MKYINVTYFFVYKLEQRTFHRPVHLFYNNVRYDSDQGIVTLLVLEADWQVLHVETVLILISSSGNCASNAVKVKNDCKTTKNNLCCFANETVEKQSRNDREMVEIRRSKRRKPRLAKNLSCVNMSCVSDHRDSGLQKYDSCYRLEIMSSQDVIIRNAGHVHKSTDCLVMEERHSKAPVRLFPSGIDSPSYQLKDDISREKMIAGDVITRNGGHAIEGDSDGKLVTTTRERMDDVTQLFGLCDLTFVTRQKAKTDHLEVAYEPKACCYCCCCCYSIYNVIVYCFIQVVSILLFRSLSTIFACPLTYPLCILFPYQEHIYLALINRAGGLYGRI